MLSVGRRRRRRRWRNSPRLTALRTRLRYGRYSAVLRHRAVWIGGGLIGLGVVWILVTGFMAQREARQLAQRIGDVRLLISQGRVDDARRLGAGIPAMTTRIDHLTGGPAWWIGAHVPWLGSPMKDARSTAAAVDDLGQHAVPQLLDVAGEIDPAHLRTSGDTIDLAPLGRAAPTLARADASLSRAIDQLRGGGSWLSALDAGRAQLRDRLSVVQGYVDAANRVARVFPTMLGGDRTRRYFIAMQNEAELRGTGGLPGAFAIAAVTHGVVHFERFSSDTVLLPARTHQLIDTGVPMGHDYDVLYGNNEPTRSYLTSNISPDFRDAARIWAAMYQKVSGERVDGVMAIDPTAMSYFLAASGPADVAGFGRTVTAGNVVGLTERDAYVLYPDNGQRKAFLVAVLKATANKLLSGSGSAIGLLQAATRSSSEQRLLSWYDGSDVEKAIQETSYGGTLPSAASRRPFSAVVLNNAAAGKLDYYLQRSIDYARTGCGPRRDVVVTVTLANDAPPSGLPPYVTTRLDNPRPAGVRPGDNRTLLDYFGTPGSHLQSVTIDGKQSVAQVLALGAFPVFRLDLELPRGKTRTVSLHLDEPARPGRPDIWRQPGVTPLGLNVFSQVCG